ncbi:MAG: hypothetical protein HYZ01_07550 [Ignavibacteriales bacterium]|nr:hypothetical protein [Ignavibacteriales bacterium]
MTTQRTLASSLWFLLTGFLLLGFRVYGQDPRALYESAELAFQKGNYASALSSLRQLEGALGRKNPRVQALKTKVLDSDGKILDAKLAVEELLRLANPSTRSSEGFPDIGPLKDKIDRALADLERRWPLEIQNRRMEEADRLIQEQEARQERKLQAKRAAASQFEIREWQGAAQENIADGYKAFVERYPNSSHIREARSRAETASFREAEEENTAEAYRQFLEEYPKSLFSLKAQDRFEELLYAEVERERTPEALARYLEVFPRGRYTSALRQRLVLLQEDSMYSAAVNEARGLYRYYAFKRYLRTYPRGKYADAAYREAGTGTIKTPPALSEPAWLDHYERGVQAMEAERYDEAAGRFLLAIEERERDAQTVMLSDGRRIDYFPHRELGIALMHLGIADFAREELNTSISYIWTLRAQEALERLGK